MRAQSRAATRKRRPPFLVSTDNSRNHKGGLGLRLCVSLRPLWSSCFFARTRGITAEGSEGRRGGRVRGLWSQPLRTAASSAVNNPLDQSQDRFWPRYLYLSAVSAARMRYGKTRLAHILRPANPALAPVADNLMRRRPHGAAATPSSLALRSVGDRRLLSDSPAKLSHVQAHGLIIAGRSARSQQVLGPAG